MHGFLLDMIEPDGHFSSDLYILGLCITILVTLITTLELKINFVALILVTDVNWTATTGCELRRS